MKKSIGVLLVGSLLLTGIGHVKADWIKDQQGKWEYFFNEDSISHLYDEKSKEGRRQEVLKHTNLVMLFGDNLVDFAEFSTKSEARLNALKGY